MWGASSRSCDDRKRIKRGREVVSDVKEFTRLERSEGILDVHIGGRVDPVHQESM